MSLRNRWFCVLPKPNQCFPFGTLGFSSDGEKKIQFLIWCIRDHNLALGFNLLELEFTLFPNRPSWFPLIKSILIYDDSPIDSPN